jgi:predicted transcriptional regulator
MAITIELPAGYFDRLTERADAAGKSAVTFASEVVAAGIEARDRVSLALQSGGSDWSVDSLAEAEYNELTWRIVHGARGDDRAFALDERGKWRELATDRRPAVVISIELSPDLAARLTEQAALEEERTASDLAVASVVIVLEPT